MSVKGDEDLSKRTLLERLKESFYKERFEKCKKKNVKYSEHKIYHYCLALRKHASGMFSGGLL